MDKNRGLLDFLANALLNLRNQDEVTAFLSDLLTKSEQLTLKMRMQVAKMLRKGLPYTQIVRETGASSATIAKVSENYKYGNDGLKLALERLDKKDNNKNH
ncbi:MAG TPA: YerC/YecD family TrpR-related protein [Candidatus Dojkabacteria bacterium]|nr:YerC/YecD family TrpR-related protein [Candidatus Dojkabacteria bacterium]